MNSIGSRRSKETSASFTFLLKDVSFYQDQLIKNKVVEKLNLSSEQSQIVNDEISNIILYLTDKKETLDSNLFGEQENLHMQDVKNIVSKVILASYILLALVIVLLIFDKERGRTLMIGGIASIIGYVLLGLILLNFDFFFIKFHELIFSNKLWLFPADSPIVNIFPKQFFVDFL